MKKGIIIAVVAVAVLGAGGAAAYKMYQTQEENKAYEESVSATITSLPPITVYEKDDLPSVEEEFAGTESVINLESVQPDISNVYTTEPGSYSVKYTFTDSKGGERTAEVPCIVKPNLPDHVTGMQDITMKQGEEIPTVDLTYDEYVDSVSLNTDQVDPQTAASYDISYSILGTDGEMEVVDGFTCTVEEIPDLTLSVDGMKSIEIKQGDEIPTEADVVFKSNVASVTLNTGDVDNKTPGVYNISYSILGTDGSMTTVEKDSAGENYTCTVIEVETEKESENETEAETVDPDAVGNVEVQENVVETGDTTNFIIIFAAFAACAAAIAGAIVYRKKKRG